MTYKNYEISKFTIFEKSWIVILLTSILMLVTGCSSSSDSSSSSSGSNSSGSSLIGTWAICSQGDEEDTEILLEFENDGDYFMSTITYSTTDGTCASEYLEKNFLSYKYSTNSSNTAFTIDDLTDWKLELSDSGITDNNNICGLNDWQGGYAKSSVAIEASFSSTKTRYLHAIPNLPDDGDTEQELLDAGDFDYGFLPLITYYYLNDSYCSAYQDIDHDEELAFTISENSLTITVPEGTLILSKQ